MAYCSLNGMACFDPLVFFGNVSALASSDDCQWIDIAKRLRLAGLTNRFTKVSGPASSYGYFAASRAVMNKIKDVDITLEMQGGTTPIKQAGLVFVRATGMAPVMPNNGSDGDSFVVEVADRRYYGNHPWMKLDALGQKMFNVPAVAYGQDQYYEDTINEDTGLPWTWQQMFDELWPDFLKGRSPSLGDVFVNNPVGFDFRSYTNYQAIQIILNQLTLSLALDDDGSYYIINTGVTDEDTPFNDQLINKFKSSIDEDIEYIEPVRTYYPIGVSVMFQKTATNSGSENVFTKENGQWYTDMIHTEYVLAGSNQLSTLDRNKLLANTYHQIWDDMPAWVDPYSGDIANQTDLTNRANDRMADFYHNLITDNIRTHGSYSALVPFTLCGTMQAVSWVQQIKRGGAWTTEYWCHPREQAGIDGGTLIPVTTRPESPWQWRSAPVYPPETMLWRNDGILTSGSASGSSDDEYNGAEIRYDPATKRFIDGIYVKGVPNP